MFPDDTTVVHEFSFARYPIEAHEPFEFIRNAHGPSVSTTIHEPLWYLVKYQYISRMTLFLIE